MALDHVRAGETVSLRPEAMDLSRRQASALVKSDAFEAARLVLPAGSEIPPHRVAGDIILHCLDGRVTLEADEAVELRGGDWLYLEGETEHALSAIEDSALLLTILFDRAAAAAG